MAQRTRFSRQITDSHRQEDDYDYQGIVYICFKYHAPFFICIPFITLWSYTFVVPRNTLEIARKWSPIWRKKPNLSTPTAAGEGPVIIHE